MSSNQTKTNGDEDAQPNNAFVLDSLPPAVRDFLEDEGQRSNLTYYNISRPKGSKLDILHQYSVNQNGGGEEQEESTLAKTIGICNIVSLSPFIWNGRYHEDTYLNAVSNALAIQHLNLGDGSIVKEVKGLNETCNLRFTQEFIETQGEKHIAVDRVLRRLEIDTISDKADHFENNRNAFSPCAFSGAWRSGVTEHTAIITGLHGFSQGTIRLRYDVMASLIYSTSVVP